MRSKKIRRIKVPQFTVANGSTAAVSKSLGSLNGTLKQAIVTINDNTGNATATLALIDEDSLTLWTETGIAENATTPFQYYTLSGTDLPLTILMDGTMILTMTPSGDPGAGGMTVDVVLFIEE